MKNYKVYFHTKHNPDQQVEVVSAVSGDVARTMFEITGCTVDDVSLARVIEAPSNGEKYAAMMSQLYQSLPDGVTIIDERDRINHSEY